MQEKLHQSEHALVDAKEQASQRESEFHGEVRQIELQLKGTVEENTSQLENCGVLQSAKEELEVQFEESRTALCILEALEIYAEPTHRKRRNVKSRGKPGVKSGGCGISAIFRNVTVTGRERRWT